MSEDAPNPESPQPPARWLDRHLWQIQPVRDLLMIAALVGLFWLGYKLSIVTVPLLLAITSAYLFEPVIRRMTRIAWMSRQGAAAAIIGLSVLMVLAPIVIGLAFATIQGVQLASDVAETATSIKIAVDNPENETAQGRVRGRIPTWIRDQILEADARAQARAEQDAEVGIPMPGETGTALQVVLTWIENNAQAVTQRALQTGANAFDAFFRTVTSIIYIGFTLFLTAFFFFFIASGYGQFLEFSSKFIPDAHRDRTLDLLHKFDAVISGFVRGRLTIAFIQSIVFTLGYWFIGVPAPVLLGVGVAVLSIVPYAALIGIPISILLLWIEPHTGYQSAIWWTVGAPVVLYFVGQALDDYVWTPLIQGKSTGMDTPTILFATLAGGSLMGVYGLLLAIPLAACLKIILQEIIWPRFQDWIAGRRKDFLPIDGDS
ncbi:MAG TPA: AI-2E family transporter [Phycisphaerales bacterium]|nr:AI-2E family transporter [Phycisphaerales bacterium]